MRVRIENVTLVTTDEANRVFENGCLVWEDDTILALNDFSVPVDEAVSYTHLPAGWISGVKTDA